MEELVMKWFETFATSALTEEQGELFRVDCLEKDILQSVVYKEIMDKAILNDGGDLDKINNLAEKYKPIWSARELTIDDFMEFDTYCILRGVDPQHVVATMRALTDIDRERRIMKSI